MSLEYRALALAGIFQAVHLVDQIARRGLVDHSPFESSIKSLLTLDAKSTEEVYGGIQGVKTGLTLLCRQFVGPSQQQNKIVVSYVNDIALLERKFIVKERMVQQIRYGIEEVISVVDRYPVTDPHIIEMLARLYLSTLSTLDFRIQVIGEPNYLKDQANADKIRALLLAGIRSAVLWQQKGGTDWQLRFHRKKMAHTAQQWLEKISEQIQ